MPKTARNAYPVEAVGPQVITFSVLTREDLRVAAAVLGISTREVHRTLCTALREHGGSLDTEREVYDRWRARVGFLRVLYVVHSAELLIVTEVTVRPPQSPQWIHAELLTG